MTGPTPPSSSISPARLNTIIAGLWICLFVAALDTTILTTSLIKIASSFDALEQAAWLITSYLLTYNCKFCCAWFSHHSTDHLSASLLIASKLSDIWGIRNVMLTYAAIFLVFSMACGAAQSMLQL
jgi:MFS family permease